MPIVNQKVLSLLMLLAVVFSVIPIPSKALLYQTGQVLGDSTSFTYPTGSLMLDSGTVYFIYQQSKIPFTSPQAFLGLGYSFNNLQVGDITNYTFDPSYTLNSPTQAHPWGQFVNNQGTVYYVSPDGLIGVPSTEVFISNGGIWQHLVPANAADINTLNSNPNLTPLTDNDPRLGSTPGFYLPTPTPTATPTFFCPPNADCSLPILPIPTPTPTATVSATPTPSVTITPTPTPTVVPSISITPTPVPTVTPTTSLGLTSNQSDTIKKDLQTIKSLGFKRVRIITFTRTPGDTNYANWPANVFITYPKPTDAELTNLKQYLQLIDQAGLTYEFVLVPPDTKSEMYTSQTAQDYKNFIDAIWPVMWTGKLDAIEVGGDLTLNPPTINTQTPNVSPTGQNVVTYDRQWLLDMWAYTNSKCPGCNVGLEVYTSYAKFWDLGAANLTWVKANLSPQPKFVGVQYYPTSQAALTNLEFEQGTTINWTAAVQDWYQNLKAAAGTIPLIADEIGLDLQLGFTEQNKTDFYQATATYLTQQGVHFNIWELYDHPWQPQVGASFGLLDQNGNLLPSATTVQNILTPTESTDFTAGIQYDTPGSVGWQFIMPQN